jgi:glutathione S-transferase
MKLYFSPGACSLSPHIVLREAGIPFDLEQVNIGVKKTKSGADFREINPKGYVPVLQLDDGQILTEGPAIVQYLADQKPESKLAPAAGTMERYRLLEWLNYISTELHKAFSPLFNAKTPAETKSLIKEQLAAKFDFVTKQLGSHPYLLGEHFTVADAYLFTVLRWTRFVEIDLSKWPVLTAFQARVGERPAVRDAIAAEKGQGQGQG